jgi:hypothetical protein
MTAVERFESALDRLKKAPRRFASASGRAAAHALLGAAVEAIMELGGSEEFVRLLLESHAGGMVRRAEPTPGVQAAHSEDSAVPSMDSRLRDEIDRAIERERAVGDMAQLDALLREYDPNAPSPQYLAVARMLAEMPTRLAPAMVTVGLAMLTVEAGRRLAALYGAKMSIDLLTKSATEGVPTLALRTANDEALDDDVREDDVLEDDGAGHRILDPEALLRGLQRSRIAVDIPSGTEMASFAKLLGAISDEEEEDEEADNDDIALDPTALVAAFELPLRALILANIFIKSLIDNGIAPKTAFARLEKSTLEPVSDPIVDDFRLGEPTAVEIGDRIGIVMVALAAGGIAAYRAASRAIETFQAVPTVERHIVEIAAVLSPDGFREIVTFSRSLIQRTKGLRRSFTEREVFLNGDGSFIEMPDLPDEPEDDEA